MASDQLDSVGKFLTDYNIKTLENVKLYDNERESLRIKIIDGNTCEVNLMLDLMQVVRNELELYNLIRDKVEELNINQIPNMRRIRKLGKKVLGIQYQRINEFYTYMFTMLGMPRVYLDLYIAFCTTNLLIDECSQFISAMINTEQSIDPKLYDSAARFEFKIHKSITKARQYYELGASHHVGNIELPLYEILMEIEHSDMSDTCLVKYEQLLTTYLVDITKHVSFLNDTLKIYPKTNTSKMSSFIANDLVELYKHDELLWHHLAQFELKGYTYNPQLLETKRFFFHNKTPLNAVKSCMTVYEDTLNQSLYGVNKRNLTTLYLDAIIDLLKSDFMKHEDIKKYIQEKMAETFQSVHFKDIILNTPKYCVYWTKKGHDYNRQINLTEALKVLKTDMELWTELLSIYISSDNCYMVINTLKKAMCNLKFKSLPLWHTVLRYLFDAQPDMVEQFYREGCFNACKKIAIEIRSEYLEWCVTQKGIDECRFTFGILKTLDCLTPKLYLTMINCEKSQIIEDDNDKDFLKNILTEACFKFGKSNTEVWLECIIFEYTYGTPVKANEIYEKSLTFLYPDVIPIMESKFNELKSNIEAKFTEEVEELMEEDIEV